jgi:hypothetical protein
MDARESLLRLADGYLVTAALHVAVDLGVADALAAGPLTAAELAEALGADPGHLHRVLRLLAAEGVLAEAPAGFALTPLGSLLRTDGVESQRGAVLARGRVYAGVVGALPGAVRSGDVAFDRARGLPFFEWLAGREAERAAFQTSMTARSAREAAAVVAAYDFGRFRRVVDVGGGTGVLLDAIRAANSQVEGVLFDRPEVAEPAGGIGGDFFVSVPVGGDAYTLSRVLHDWADPAALQILRTCRAAMPTGTPLLVVEAVLPARAVDAPAVVRMDATMLLLATGRERTETEFAQLFAAAGFRLAQAVPAGDVVVLEAR